MPPGRCPRSHELAGRNLLLCSQPCSCSSAQAAAGRHKVWVCAHCKTEGFDTALFRPPHTPAPDPGRDGAVTVHGAWRMTDLGKDPALELEFIQGITTACVPGWSH